MSCFGIVIIKLEIDLFYFYIFYVNDDDGNSIYLLNNFKRLDKVFYFWNNE